MRKQNISIVGDHDLTEDTQVSVDGTYGEVFLGSLPIAVPEPFQALDVFKEWWDIYDGTKGIRPPQMGGLIARGETQRMQQILMRSKRFASKHGTFSVTISGQLKAQPSR